MAGGIRYWREKYELSWSLYQAAKEELSLLLRTENSVAIDQDSGRRVLVGKRSAEALVKKYKRQNMSDKKNLVRHARAVVIWYKLKDEYVSQIKQSEIEIAKLTASQAELEGFLRIGATLTDAELLFLSTVSKKILSWDKNRYENGKKLKQHLENPARDSLKQAHETLAEFENDILDLEEKKYNDYSPLEQILPSIVTDDKYAISSRDLNSVSTDLTLDMLRPASEARAEVDSQSTTINTSCEHLEDVTKCFVCTPNPAYIPSPIPEDAELSAFDKEMIAAQNAQRVIHKI